jgi:hypothetical protein
MASVSQVYSIIDSRNLCYKKLTITKLEPENEQFKNQNEKYNGSFLR